MKAKDDRMKRLGRVFLSIIALSVFLLLSFPVQCYAQADSNTMVNGQPDDEAIHGKGFLSVGQSQSLLNQSTLENTDITIKEVAAQKKGHIEKEVSAREPASHGHGPSIAITGNKSFDRRDGFRAPRTASWNKGGIRTSESSTTAAVVTQSNVLEKMEKQRKDLKESLRKSLEANPSRNNILLNSKRPENIVSKALSSVGALSGEDFGNSDSRIAASPEYLALYAVEGATASQSQTFAISNSGIGTLTFNLIETAAWLSVDTSSGSVTTNKAVITIMVNPTGLSSSTSPYISDITISNADVPQDTKKVRVRLSVLTSDAYVHSYQYDSNGRLVRRITPRGDIIEYAYNAAGRLTDIYYPDGRAVNYTYDAAGNRTSMTDWHGATLYIYDELNRLRYVAYPGINYIYYEYDKSGNIIKMRYPSQDEVSYGYDNDNRLRSVTAPSGATSYEYDNLTNNLKKKILPNGVYTEYAYDLAKRVTDVSNKRSDGSLISGYHYTYDANNNIKDAIETTASGTITKTYTYDKLNRLTRSDSSDGTFEAFAYDAMGNRLTRTTETGSINYEYDSDNRLLQAGDTYFFYDKNGNLIKKVSPQKTEEYQYDYNNMLIRYSSGSDIVQYEYDGNGNRIAKIVNGLRVNYVNDVNRPIVQVLLEADFNWAVTKKYVYGLDLISQEEM